MSRATRLTYLLLFGSFLLICVSAYLLITQARDLSSARKNLDEANMLLAQRQAQLLVLTDAMIAVQDQASQVDPMVGQTAHNVRTICARQRNTNAEVRALCALAEWATGSSGAFVVSYAATAANRASAKSPADWQNVKREYAELKGRLTTDLDPGHQWAARIDEGIAYSDYRLGQVDAARGEADRAFGLDSRSAFVGLTRLKIACSAKVPAAEIARLHAEQRKNLQASVRDPIPPMNKRYAELELGYFDQDSEVRATCSYANLPEPPTN